MKDLKIGKKLLVVFGIIIALFCITAVLAIYSLISTGNSYSAFYETPYQVTNKASDMRTSIQAFGKNVGYAMMENDEAQTEEYVQQARNELKILDEGIAFMKKEFDGDPALVTGVEQEMSGVASARDEVLQLALDMKNDQAIELYFEKVRPGLVEAQNYLSEINDIANESAANYYKASKQKVVFVTVILLILCAVTLIATIVLALAITRGLTVPIQELEAVANELANGNLGVTIKYTSKDELGGLAASTRTMIERVSYYMREITDSMEQLASGDLNVRARETFLGDFKPVQDAIRKQISSLNGTLTQIYQAADQVSAGADQVSAGAQALSQGATEQASSVEELAATLSDISGQVKKNAQSAQQAKDTVDEVGQKLLDSNRQMQEMTSAMEEISASSGEIGKIIKTIEDIAFQTNILALNAAVEAARAGSAGKGFAVVADEVRNLASKSSDASKSTSALIESSLMAVENGTRIADETAASLLTVVEGTKEITNQINSIADASNEQSNSLTEINQGVDQISSVVQTNSATAEESAAASEELFGQAQMMKSLVGQFKLKDTGMSKPVAVTGGKKEKQAPAPEAPKYSEPRYSEPRYTDLKY